MSGGSHEGLEYGRIGRIGFPLFVVDSPFCEVPSKLAIESFHEVQLMARIRTVKPEFWTDERVGECSVSARLLLIGSLNFADDEGGLDRSAKQLKAQVFPYDAIDCEPLVLELIRVGLFIEYEVLDRKYLHIKGFSKHQKVENKAKPKIPLYEPSANAHLILTESSPSPHLAVVEEKLSLREGIKEGIKDQGSKSRSSASRLNGDDPRQALWDLGKRILGTDAGSIIGLAIKRVGQEKVGEILGSMATKPPAEPKTYFLKATQERGVVV